MYNFLKLTESVKPKHIYNVRRFWQWLNIIFNSVDEDRRKVFGPDRTCAEWLLRNGAAVRFANATEYLSDYNSLPPEGTKLYIKEIDATDSSISHYGFRHFSGCRYIEKIIFHKCTYLENEALPMLHPLRESLKYLKVSSCGNITGPGLIGLISLNNLTQLEILDLPYLKEKDLILKNLKRSLPKCSVSIQ